MPKVTSTLVLLFLLPAVQAATVTSDTVTVTLCADGYFYAGGCPDPALTGLQRYVKNGGNDTFDGLTDATAWASVSKCSSLPTSTDCNLKSGSTFSSRMTINWPGTNADWAVVRCYKMVGGLPYECVSTDTKPVLLGNLTQACLDAGTCDYRPSAFEAEGLGTYGAYLAQYTISATADYTEHKYISIKKTRGRGVNIQGTGSAGSLHHVKVTGVDTDDTGFDAIVIESGVADAFVKNGDFGFFNTCIQQRQLTGATLTPDCAVWGGGIAMVRMAARILIEGNTVHNGLGEGMNCYQVPNSFSIFRNNTVAAVWSGGKYDDICTDSVTEGNRFIGTRGSLGYITSGAADWGGGLNAYWEDFNLPTAGHTERILWRNNLAVGTGQCIGAGPETAASIAGRYAEVRAYGNTCVDPNNEAVISGDSGVSNSTRLDAQNNVIWSDIAAGSVCKINAAGTQETMVDNHWSTTPSQAHCQGAGDTSGAPGLTAGSYATWAAYNYSNPPTFATAAPTSGAPIKDSGACLTGALLTAASYGFAADNMTDVLSGAITLENWVLQNALDANGVVRGAACSKGAVE